ncbi:NO-binding membrane sensor protein with MHYT domain [Nocardia pseudobrasiliensis]|uniref:NO-binding membrane sensor protein with MHYT domain n=2 Tax=Nocardia pseudobrasiliensis TaxID=45979 RepID=A0A370I7F9_9NOCA|nr:NO-binding membrane sensor protein with MHYT domain [Nocardia pseudobrasiliensis]
MGLWVLVLSLGVSLAGALVGLACIRQSMLSVTAKFRLVWLTAAAVSIGAVGTWLAVYVNMLGIGVAQGDIRYDVWRVAVAAVLAVVSVLGGLLVAGRSPAPPRLAAGSAVMGLGLGLMHVLGMTAIHVQGAITLNPFAALGATVLAVAAAAVVLITMGRPRALLLLAGAALVFAILVCALHYLGLTGVRVRIDPAMRQPAGDDLFTLFVPVFVLGTLSLAVPITAVLVAPDRSRSNREPQQAARPRARRRPLVSRSS